MDRIEKIGHAVGTLNIHIAGGGDTKDVLDAKVNEKMAAEGWDDVQLNVVHVNRTGEEVTSLVILYKYIKYANSGAAVEEPVKRTYKKKAE